MVASTDNFVKQKSTTTGTGNFTLSDLSPARRSFNTAFGTGGTDVFQYAIFHQGNNQFEFGTGHLSDSTTLVRDTVEDSSNGDSLVDFTSGDKIVLCDIPASKYGPALDIGDDDNPESDRFQELASQNEPSSNILNNPSGDKARFDWSNITAIAGVGNRELIERKTITSAQATVDFTSGIDSNFESYLIYIPNLVPATDATALYLRVSTDGGSTYESSSYDWVNMARDSGGGAGSGNGAGDSKIKITGNNREIGNASGQKYAGKLHMFDPANTSRHTHFWYSSAYTFDIERMTALYGSGRYNNTSAVDAFRLFMSNGDVSIAKVELWGVG